MSKYLEYKDTELYRVARNIKHFETWATHQGCEQVALSDLPEELGEDVAFVFNLSARIPSEWIDTVCQDLSTYVCPEHRAGLINLPTTKVVVTKFA